MRRARNDRGQALIEAALTIPILLLIAIGIFEFGRAYQTWEILTNAAREGARMAILPTPNSAVITQRVRDYMQAGGLSNYNTAQVQINPTTITVTTASGTVSVPASEVVIDYPFDFMFMAFHPTAHTVSGTSTDPADSLTMHASVVMRNE